MSLDFAFNLLFRQRAKNFFHHCQMFTIIMGLKQSESKVQFKHDATNAPNITGLWPAKFYMRIKYLYGPYIWWLWLIYIFYQGWLLVLYSVLLKLPLSGAPNQMWLNQSQSTSHQCSLLFESLFSKWMLFYFKNHLKHVLRIKSLKPR